MERTRGQYRQNRIGIYTLGRERGSEGEKEIAREGGREGEKDKQREMERVVDSQAYRDRCCCLSSSVTPTATQSIAVVLSLCKVTYVSLIEPH
jgi:hypothetical protein